MKVCMNRFALERFASVRTLREDRYAKTFLADDHLLDRENVVVKVIKKDHIRRGRDELIEQLSWLIGVRHPHFADLLDAGLTKQQHLYYVREYLPASDLYSVEFVALMKSLVSAVDFLSLHNRVHGAIKLSNILE